MKLLKLRRKKERKHNKEVQQRLEKHERPIDKMVFWGKITIEDAIEKYAEKDFSNGYFNYTYDDLVKVLLEKYGPVNESYFKYTKDRKSCYRNPNLVYPEGAHEIHHIREDTVARLSRKEMGMLFPQFQSANQLVYANIKEHTILHYLIHKEAILEQKTLGVGGILNFLMGAFECCLDENWKQDYLIMLAKIAKNALKHIITLEIHRKSKKLFETILLNNPIEVEAWEEEKSTRLQEQAQIHLFVIENFEVGITKLSFEEYKHTIGEVFGWSSKFEKGKCFYVLRTNINNTAVVYKNQKGGLSLIKGRTFTKCPFTSIEKLFKHLDEIISLTQDFNAQVLSYLKPVSDYIKAKGGKGTIHGLIVDVDSINHIGLDSKTFNLIGYTSTMEDWYNNRTIHISNTPLELIEKTLPQNQLIDQNVFLPQIIENKLCTIAENSNQTIQCVKGISENNFGSEFYRLSRKTFEAQKTGEFKHLVFIPEYMDDSYEWDNLPQIDYYADMIEV